MVNLRTLVSILDALVVASSALKLVLLSMCVKEAYSSLEELTRRFCNLDSFARTFRLADGITSTLEAFQVFQDLPSGVDSVPSLASLRRRCERPGEHSPLRVWILGLRCGAALAFMVVWRSVALGVNSRGCVQ